MAMVQTILVQLIMFALSKPWFRAFLIKLITSSIESTLDQQDSSQRKQTEVDRQIAEFVREHRRAIVTIINKEVDKDTSPVDERLREAIKSLKTK